MIHIHTKRYQLSLWLTGDRSGLALRSEFDSREEAEHAFKQGQAEGRYLTGILYEWDKRNQEWTLFSQYP